MRVAFLLALICVSMRCPAAGPSPVVKPSDPFAVTHKFMIGEITIGVSDLGGGYLNFIDLGDGKNIVSGNYGRGWQGSVRDQLHGGRYNPTQAGFRDDVGAPVTVVATEHSIKIPKFNLPLYGDPVFDFTEHEDIAPDFKGYKDNGNSDTDGIEESNLTQDDEVRSEFDFEGIYEDATDLAGGKIPVLRFYSLYTYARPPAAIRQFGKTALLSDGKPVINETARVKDVSPAMTGNQPAADDDLSGVIFTAYGARLLADSGYTVPMWREKETWKILPELESGRGKEMEFCLPGPAEAGKSPPVTMDSEFLVLAKGNDPANSPAIALYSPSSDINTNQILGLDKATGRVIYKEDRRTQGKILFSRAIPAQVDMRNRYFLTGMLAPGHGKPNVLEALQNETFILFGTPDQILKAVEALKKKLNVKKT
ncbi:MAG: hypothetical protein D4R65_00385 [Verrucomicrobiaceae bacterium]|nr:MAG: hypothetical protein D4R65_00385 [Verrucomicrobiaceae bacterium]